MSSEAQVKKILLLTANPKGTGKLRLDEEARDIKEGLRRAQERDWFEIRSEWAVRPRDIRRAILDFKPHIVHFSGHGAADAGLAFENDSGQIHFVPSDALAGLFKLFANHVECVLLNACYSEVQANAIAQHIDFVVGMNTEIGDRAAIEFSVGFYDAIGAGCIISNAYEFGCNAIQLAGIQEHLTPVLKKKTNFISSDGDISDSKHSSYEKDTTRTITLESPPKTMYEFVLSGNIDEFDKQRLEAIVAHLQRITGDVSLTLLKVQAGSVKLIFEGSPEGFRRLQALFETEQLTEILNSKVQSISSLNPETQERIGASDTKALVRYWRNYLQQDLLDQSSETQESIIQWLLGEDQARFDNLLPSQLGIAKQAMDYRYRILQQRYLQVVPERAYKELIQRLSSLFLIRNRIRTWIALSQDRRQSVVDVLQEVIQELLQTDHYMQQQIAWIAKCTSDPRLRNALVLASTEEYCLRPIRNQPLLVYRFVNYLRRSQRGGMTQVPVADFIRLVSEEIVPDDSEGSVSLLDGQAITHYQEAQVQEQQQELQQTIAYEFESYLAERVDPLAAEWLKLYLQGRSQEAIAQDLDMPIKQIYSLREKVNHHAVRLFAQEVQSELVMEWLNR